MSVNIVRRSGDTFPVKASLKINGVPISLDEWRVELRYKKDNIVMVIDGLLSNAGDGKVMFFPHARLQTSPELAYDKYVSNDMIGVEKLDGSGPYTEADVNQVWDENEANAEYPYYIVRIKKFGDYQEEQTHIVGNIQLLSRFEVN